MAYEQENFEDSIRTQFGLSEADQAAVIAFLNTSINGDMSVTTENFEGNPDTDVQIPAGIEAAAIKSGGSFTTSGENVFINVETDEPVTINGQTVPGGSVVILGGGGSDTIRIVSGPSADTLGVVSFNTGDADAGTGLVIAGAGDDTVSGGDGGDMISGGVGNDMIMAGMGDDTLDGGVGDDTVDGGAGFDMMMVRGATREDFTVAVENGQLVLTGVADGESDLLSGVEYISFEQGGIVLGLADQEEGAIARLYEMLLDRAAAAGGLDFWLEVAEDGASLAKIASKFLASGEFADSVEGELSNEEFVELMFERGLKREGGEGGVAFFTRVLDEGEATRAEIAAAFARSEEAEDLYDYINIITDSDLG